MDHSRARTRFSSTVCSGLVSSKGAENLAGRYVSENWYKSDVRAARAIPALRRGRDIVTEIDLFQPEEIKQSRFYSDFLHTSGFGWFAASLLCEVDGIVTALSIDRRQDKGPFTKDALAQIERHLPHIRKASRLASMSRLAGAYGIVTHLEQIGCGAILIDWLGRVIRVNKQAEAHIGTCFHLASSRLQLSDHEANRSLQDFVTASIKPLFDNESEVTEPLVVRRLDNLPLIITSYPVALQASDVFQGARAILLIKDPGEATVLPRRVLRETFRLTPTEYRVASLLFAGFNTQHAAAELGVSTEAIRFHLKSMFAKTGTKQQTQLVSLLASFSRQSV